MRSNSHNRADNCSGRYDTKRLTDSITDPLFGGSVFCIVKAATSGLNPSVAAPHTGTTFREGGNVTDV